MIDTNWFLTQGVLGVILLVLGIALWRIILWAKIKVVEPMVESHLNLIKSLSEHMPKQTDSIDSQTRALASIAENQKVILRKVLGQPEPPQT